MSRAVLISVVVTAVWFSVRLFTVCSSTCPSVVRGVQRVYPQTDALSIANRSCRQSGVGLCTSLLIRPNDVAKAEQSVAYVQQVYTHLRPFRRCHSERIETLCCNAVHVCRFVKLRLSVGS